MAEARPGDVLAQKYRVERVLGEGGMGIVVAATHLQLQQKVALKFLRESTRENEEVAARFLREARSAVRLKSQHVTRVLDLGTLDSGEAFIVMEYLDGEDLGALIERRGALPVSEAVDYVLQACEALAEAHGLGIIHRDLKPPNLFLTTGSSGAPLVKVLDFGISKSESLTEDASTLTKTDAVMGSPMYMPPEQMRSSKSVDARADIWALAVILQELVGGRRPFDGATLGELFAQVFAEIPRRLIEVKPDVDPRFDAAVMRCLEKDRTLRFGSIAELAKALAPFTTNAQAAIERIVQASTAPPPPSAVDAVSVSVPRSVDPPRIELAPSTRGVWGVAMPPPPTTTTKFPRGALLAIAAGAVLVGVTVVVAINASHAAPAATADTPVASTLVAASHPPLASAPPPISAVPIPSATASASAPAASTRAPQPKGSVAPKGTAKPKGVMDDWN